MKLAQNLDSVATYANLNNASRADIATILERALPFVFGAAGLLLLIYIIMGGFQLMFSKGDPKAVAAGWAKVTNAVIGFLLVILAYALVSIIGRVFGISVFGTIFGRIGPGR